jgi:cytochrome c biogenesis protein CcdA
MQIASAFYLRLTSSGVQWSLPHSFSGSAHFFDLVARAARDKRRRVMDAMLLMVAWAAGITGLFLVADMIAADILERRAERIAQRSNAQRMAPGRRR